jgi:hypothetical protein
MPTPFQVDPWASLQKKHVAKAQNISIRFIVLGNIVWGFMSVVVVRLHGKL